MTESSRRYLSLWLRCLPTDRIARTSQEPDDAPLVVVAPVKAALRIAALNDGASRLGLKPGMALADARAMHPALIAVNADAEADRALLDAVADWCDRYTPLIGLDAPDGLLLDITGCAHLFGGERALAHDMLVRLARQGFHAQAGIADSVGCAWAVSHFTAGGLVAKGENRKALLPLPLAALRLPPDIVAGLAQAGLKRIADVIERPRAALAARFGEEFIRRIDQALGHADEPITPRLPVPSAIAERRFPDPIALEADILSTIEQLAGELGHLLERRGEGARRIGLALFRADGKVNRLEIGTAEPLRDAARVRRLFADRLVALGDECDPGFGFDMVRLSALSTERCDPVQTGLDNTDHSAELAHLIDRLGARFGLRRVHRLVPQDTHIPEYAAVAMPAHAVKASAQIDLPALEQDSVAPVRPIRLFQRPEPIEAVAEVPDGPPVRFRWRHVLHEVAASEGPERIAMEWWRDAAGRALTRDYFRIESKNGARLWLFREGLYGPETRQPRWFLHGLFA